MTNLSPDQSVWRRRFSRGRILVGVPAALGLLLAGALLAGLAWPRLAAIKDQRERIDELKAKEASLPLLKLQRTKTDGELQKAQLQQSLLVELVAGRGEIETFLAQLSRVSQATGIAITLYEPVPAVVEDAPGQSTNPPPRSANNQVQGREQVVPRDPLDKLGYQKTSVLLQAEGPYSGLLAFLRQMERLELLVQPSDLALEALDDSSDADDPKPVAAPRTRLKLRLTFFDKTAQPSGIKTPSAPS